jgi:hypothetical protein
MDPGYAVLRCARTPFRDDEADGNVRKDTAWGCIVAALFFTIVIPGEAEAKRRRRPVIHALADVGRWDDDEGWRWWEGGAGNAGTVYLIRVETA